MHVIPLYLFYPYVPQAGHWYPIEAHIVPILPLYAPCRLLVLANIKESGLILNYNFFSSKMRQKVLFWKAIATLIIYVAIHHSWV
jgi:hypothetical protein